MTPQAKPTQTIFISSVYEDIRWLVFIEQALRKALPKNSSVEIWSSQRLLPGDNIVKESTRAIERASIALV
ncbi:MAG: hypothetical protein NT023_13490, partial [Armatimonadetes bacterium]|nr:hypothetical protein [Armatimonadota bacterium]